MKVLVIGLDGATWRILNPLIDNGFMPNLKEILTNGCSGILQSTIPPLTIPAWPSLATGRNPGKIGAYNLLVRAKESSYYLKPATGKVYKGNSLWDYLSEKGYRTILARIPFLYPIYKINGVMIPGFGSPLYYDCFPSTLKKKFGKIRLIEAFANHMLSSINLNDHKKSIYLIKALKYWLYEEGRLVLKISNSVDWNFLFYIISATDFLQHAFMDKLLNLPSKIESSNQLNEICKELISFYKISDSLIGNFLKILEKSGDDYLMLLVSDHGFTIRSHTFNVFKWLLQQGYMHLKQCHQNVTQPRVSMQKTFGKLSENISTKENIIKHYYLILNLIPRRILLSLMSYYNMASAKPSISQLIDVENSKIFCLEDGALYVNRKNDFYEGILEAVITNLRNYLKRKYKVNLLAHKSSRIYRGNKTRLAPDLIIEIRKEDQVWNKSADPNKPLIFKPKLPGAHDRNGIFLAFGPQIKQGYVLKKPLEIYDIAPTILHVFRCPVPITMDGRVVKIIFRENSAFAKYSIAKESEREHIIRLIKRKFSKLKPSKSQSG